MSKSEILLDPEIEPISVLINTIDVKNMLSKITLNSYSRNNTGTTNLTIVVKEECLENYSLLISNSDNINIETNNKIYNLKNCLISKDCLVLKGKDKIDNSFTVFLGMESTITTK